LSCCYVECVCHLIPRVACCVIRDRLGAERGYATLHAAPSTNQLLFSLTKVIEFGLEGSHKAAKVGAINRPVITTESEVDRVADV